MENKPTFFYLKSKPRSCICIISPVMKPKLRDLMKLTYFLHKRYCCEFLEKNIFL